MEQVGWREMGGWMDGVAIEAEEVEEDGVLRNGVAGEARTVTEGWQYGLTLARAREAPVGGRCVRSALFLPQVIRERC